MKPGLMQGLALIVCLCGPAAAAEGGIKPRCADMALKREFVSAQYIDHGAAGVSVGDVRIVIWKIWDLGRQNDVAMQVIATVVDAAGDEQWNTIEDAVIRFGNGTIRASSAASVADPADTATGGQTPLQWAVLGGTGAFAEVRGTIATAPIEDRLSDIKFSINCLAPSDVAPDIRVFSTDTYRGVAPVAPPAAAKPDKPLIPVPLGDRIYR